MDRTHRLC